MGHVFEAASQIAWLEILTITYQCSNYSEGDGSSGIIAGNVRAWGLEGIAVIIEDGNIELLGLVFFKIGKVACFDHFEVRGEKVSEIFFALGAGMADI